MRLIDSNILEHKLGDIILTNSNSIIGNCNKAIQKMKIDTDANFTHVLLCIGPKLFLESTCFKKVKIISVNDMKRDSLISNDFKVIRNLEFSNKLHDINDVSIRYEFTSKIHHHINKSYNYYGLVHQNYNQNLKTQKNAFCSELVASIYREFDQFKNSEIFNLHPLDIMPSSFEKLVDMNGWIDVTELYLSKSIYKNEEIENNYYNTYYMYTEQRETQLKTMEGVARSNRLLYCITKNLMLTNLETMNKLLQPNKISDDDLTFLLSVFDYYKFLKYNKSLNPDGYSWKNIRDLNKITLKYIRKDQISQFIEQLRVKYISISNRRLQDLLYKEKPLNNELIDKILNEIKTYSCYKSEEESLIDCSIELMKIYSDSMSKYIEEMKD